MVQVRLGSADMLETLWHEDFGNEQGADQQLKFLYKILLTAT